MVIGSQNALQQTMSFNLYDPNNSDGDNIVCQSTWVIG